MKPALVFALFVSAALLLAQSGAPQNTFVPDQIRYGPPPRFVPPGAQLAVLEGDRGASSGD